MFIPNKFENPETSGSVPSEITFYSEETAGASQDSSLSESHLDNL